MRRAKKHHLRRRLYPDSSGTESRIISFFESPITAFLTLYVLSLLVIGPYIYLHSKHRPPGFEATTAIYITEDGTFRPQFSESKLEKFFSSKQIADMEKRITEKAALLSEAGLEARSGVIIPLIQTTKNYLSRYGPPVILTKDPEHITDEQLKRADLHVIKCWLTNNVDYLAPETKKFLTGPLNQIDCLEKNEEHVRAQLCAEITGLDTPLSFNWLFVDRGWWALEVMFWSFLGVYSNTLIALIQACRKGEYAPEEFILVFPKIVLAPLLAFVSVAVWSSGLSESKISYLNLPYLLVFSFLLGFGTESLYEKLRDMVSVLVSPSTTISQTKVEEASRKLPYQYQTQDLKPVDLPPAKNFDQLEKDLATVVKARAERIAVAATAQH